MDYQREIIMICLVCGHEFDYLKNINGEQCPECKSENTINK